jgi:hypothetical protein
MYIATSFHEGVTNISYFADFKKSKQQLKRGSEKGHYRAGSPLFIFN